MFYLQSVGSRAQIERGLAGLRPELYQQMLRELSEQAKLADALGHDSMAFTEHHFHVEGFEISNNPVLLDLFVGVFVISIIIHHINREFASLDTRRLSSLRE